MLQDLWSVSLQLSSERHQKHLLSFLLGHKYDQKLPVLPALQRNLIFPGKNNHLKCYPACLSLTMSATFSLIHFTCHCLENHSYSAFICCLNSSSCIQYMGKQLHTHKAIGNNTLLICSFAVIAYDTSSGFAVSLGFVNTCWGTATIIQMGQGRRMEFAPTMRAEQEVVSTPSSPAVTIYCLSRMNGYLPVIYMYF